MAQWLGIRLLMQGTQVPSPVQEVSTYGRATKPMHHNYGNLPTLRSPQSEKPQHHTGE